MFRTNLVLRDTGDGRTWIVTQPLELRLKDNSRVVVEHGFRTDLASIPRAIQLIVPKTGKWNRASVIHDWLYKKKQIQEPPQQLGDYSIRMKDITRKQADKIFLEAMKVSGVRKTRRQAIYWGVRVGGGLYWDKCRGCG